MCWPGGGRDAAGRAGAWAAILAARGIGVIGGGLVTLRLRPRRPMLLAVWAAQVAVVPSVLLAAGAATVPIAIAAGLAGAGVMMFNTLWQTTVQRHVPAGSISRVTAYDWLGSLALFPIGLALAGPVSEAIGVSATLYASAIVEALVVGALLLLREVRTIGLDARGVDDCTRDCGLRRSPGAAGRCLQRLASGLTVPRVRGLIRPVAFSVRRPYLRA